MATLEELLSDASIADDMEIMFGADKGKFKVADLRSHRTKLSAEEKSLKEQMTAVKAKQQELAELSDQPAKLMKKLKSEESMRPPVKTEGEIDFDTDPLYGPLVNKKLKPLEAQFLELKNSLATLNTSIGESAKFLLHDYYQRRWDSIPADKRPKDKGWKDYIKVAAEKKIFNEFNLPDPVEAWNREVEPLAKTALETQVASLTAEIENLKKNQHAPRMPRPGAAGAPPAAGASKDAKTFDSVDAMIDAAFQDPMIADIAGRA